MNQKLREQGLNSAYSARWSEALVELSLAARQGVVDLEVLDALAEAAYRTDTPEALGPVQNYFKHPSIAAQMARAFLMLGDVPSAYEFLGYATDSALKAALHALLALDDSDMQASSAKFIQVAKDYPNLVYPEYWRALAAVADSLGDEELTRMAEQRSQSYAYQDPNIHFNQALRMLGKKEFVAGWRLYEFRLVPGARSQNRTQLADIPMWEGENIAGATLLIYLEQGLGDCLFSLRYLKPLMDQGIKLEIVASKPLQRLIATSYPQLRVHNDVEIQKPEYWQKEIKPDFWVYSLSIPVRAGLLRPINTLRFIQASEELVNDAKNELEKHNPRKLPIYTVNWHGRVDTKTDRSRAYTVREFAQISGILQKPCFVICIQKGALKEELKELEDLVRAAGGAFLDVTARLDDFATTAAWIMASSHLLTCDTSVAHLGGGLGHKTTVFSRHRAIWQWVIQETTPSVRPDAGHSVWYDSALVEYRLAPQITWLFTTNVAKLAVSAELDNNNGETHGR